VAKPVHARRCGDESVCNSLEGDCGVSLAMTVKRECNTPGASHAAAAKSPRKRLSDSGLTATNARSGKSLPAVRAWRLVSKDEKAVQCCIGMTMRRLDRGRSGLAAHPEAEDFEVCALHRWGARAG
jgi:hypothetical protein